MKVTERGFESVQGIKIGTDLVYRDETIPVLDLSYVEYSVNGTTLWHKLYTVLDKYTRVSNDNKATWVISAMVESPIDSTFTDTPSTATVGGIPVNTAFENMSDWEFKHRLTHPFQLPILSNLASSLPAIAEVGTTLTGTKTFTWNHTQGGNIEPTSGIIRELNTVSPIGEDIELVNDTVSLTVTIDTSTPVVKSYRIEGTSIEPSSIAPSNAISCNILYPIFKGKYSSSNLTLPRPTASEIDIANNSNRIIASSTSDVTVTINSATDDYDFIAIPTTSSLFTNWFVTTFDLGVIGGAVSPGGNLFPAPETVNLSSPNGYWSNVPYRVYITNYPSAIASITLKRS